MIIGRPKIDVVARVRAIREAYQRRWEPNAKARQSFRLKLFERQRGLCALCGEPMYLYTHVDHATSIDTYAHSNLPLDEAIQLANDECNLILVHDMGNLRKGTRDLDEMTLPFRCHDYTSRRDLRLKRNAPSTRVDSEAKEQSK